ncbi:MAG TPA: ribosome recycling factor [Solirubrobacterales bacterium]|jgi:ribosome recycling factor|nr:ribosome recycling factor [Solirubrobacterales bacterium]
MIDDLLKDADDRMKRSVEASRDRLSTVRTGRASPAVLDRVEVDYYGTQTPLNQMAQISASEAQSLTVTPYDKSALQGIERAIIDSGLGLTPNNDGNVIRIQIPQLTEERRGELVKQVRSLAEEGRVAIRNIRREVMHELKEMRTGGDVGEDDEKRGESDLQKLTDKHISVVDDLLSHKEKDLTEV